MIDWCYIGFLCNNRAKYKCNCSCSQTLICSYHLENHLLLSNKEHSIEVITKKNNFELDSELYECPCRFLNENLKNHSKYLDEHSYECPLNPFYEVIHQNPNEIIQTSLVIIYEQISAIEKIKNKLPQDNILESCDYSDLIKDSFKSLEQYSEVIGEIKNCAESAVLIRDFPFSLIEVMNIAENIKIQIEFLEKLNIAWLLEYQVKSYLLAGLKGSTEKIENIKSEINRKITDVNNWCNQHLKTKNSIIIDDAKIDGLSNWLRLISELINSNNNSEAMCFFHINEWKLIIYGTEAWKWFKITLNLSLSHYYFNKAQAIQLPNQEIFCVGDRNAFLIDLNALSLKKEFPFSMGIDHSKLIYYENCVYVFSSYTLTSLEKYDMIKCIKTVLPRPIVDYLPNISCCIYKNSILFCSDKSWRFFKFDLTIESNSEISLNGISDKSNKMIFTGNMRAYVVDDNSGIFESKIDNEYTWNKIGNHETNLIAKDIDLSNLDCVYFYHTYKKELKIYQFDLSSKRIYERENYLYRSVN